MRLLASMKIRLTGVCVFKQDSLIKDLGIGRTMFATIRAFDSVPNPVNRFSREMLRESVLCKEVNNNQLPVKSELSPLETTSGAQPNELVTGYFSLLSYFGSVPQSHTSQYGSLHIDTRIHKTLRDRISLACPHRE